MSKSRESNSAESMDRGQSSAVSRHKRQLIDDEIASRAYDLWQEKGFPEGSAEENWLQAERELELQDTELAA